MAKYYLYQVYHALNGLLAAPPSLGLVQCLLGVTILIMSTPYHYSLFEGHFISTALRVMQGLAYDQNEDILPDPARDMEQERRVFWIAFIHDTSQSIVGNTPTTHRQEDVIGCATEFERDGQGVVTAAEGGWQLDLFSLRVELANLQAEVIDQIISPKKRDVNTPQDTEAVATLVLARLDQFHRHEVFQLSACRLFELLYRSDMCHVVSLEATYFATVYRVHALLGLGKNVKINPFSLEGLQSVARMKVHKSYFEAKRLLSLLPFAPRGDVGLYWMCHRIFIAALVTIFAHHINNPESTRLQSTEMLEYNQVLADIGSMVERSPHDELLRTKEFCVTLFSKLNLN